MCRLPQPEYVGRLSHFGLPAEINHAASLDAFRRRRALALNEEWKGHQVVRSDNL